jgi:hypothetical protein|tara:strand:- start:2529 stop:2714 length:186 start_codon:yes stop_codon:yes gene_type:complete
MNIKIRDKLKTDGPSDLELQTLVSKEEAKELKKIIDAKDKAIDELTKKINGKLNNLRKEGL